MTTPELARASRAESASRRRSATAELTLARTCYDHLAGQLGVRLTDAMIGAGLLDQAAGLAVTQAGLAWLAATLEIDVAALTSSRRPLARSCLDWTERRPHLAGAAGAAVCGAFFARNWIARIPGQRAVRVTAAGELALSRLGGLDMSRSAS